MKTVNGIELDLPKSNYRYNVGNYTFYFSSEFYLENFKKNVKFFTEIESIKIKNKYKIYIDLDVYLTFVFYKKIEKRGFYVVNRKTNEEITEINFVSHLLQK
jgi:YHS domain-containing protein